MYFIRGTSVPIKPSDKHPYFDKVQFWLRTPANKAALDHLRQHCGHFYVDNRTSSWDRNLVQRVELKQPKLEAVQWLAERNDAVVNQLEVALDFIFPSLIECEDAFDFLNMHIVRRWHGVNQDVRIISTTRYDSGRRARNSIVLYPERVSRVTGELNCVHLEWRLRSAQAVRSAGILQPLDLLDFDHHDFWQTRLLLCTANTGLLGRYIRNLHQGSRRRTIELLDRRLGHAILHGHSSIQELIDRYRKMRIRRVLTRLDSSALLPRA